MKMIIHFSETWDLSNCELIVTRAKELTPEELDRHFEESDTYIREFLGLLSSDRKKENQEEN